MIINQFFNKILCLIYMNITTSLIINILLIIICYLTFTNKKITDTFDPSIVNPAFIGY